MYTKFENNPSRGFLVIALTPLRAAGGGWRATGGGRLWRKTITSPDPSDTGDIIITFNQTKTAYYQQRDIVMMVTCVCDNHQLYNMNFFILSIFMFFPSYSQWTFFQTYQPYQSWQGSVLPCKQSADINHPVGTLAAVSHTGTEWCWWCAYGMTFAMLKLSHDTKRYICICYNLSTLIKFTRLEPFLV